ncbi:MAG: ATP-binding protein [Thermodesulfobacteriota bacterium]|nr:ATP-binding protein [Thermodesulfobacteriota bacterium]
MSFPLLIVEDDLLTLTTLTRLFQNKGYKIFTTSSGKEGLQILKDHTVALILSSQTVQEMSGIEFLSQAKTICHNTLRILTTSYTNVETTLLAINEVEVFRIIEKPFHYEKLESVIEEAFKRYCSLVKDHRLQEVEKLKLKQYKQEQRKKNAYRKIEVTDTRSILDYVIRNSEDGILVSDLSGNIISFNHGAERITGYLSNDVVGKINAAHLYQIRTHEMIQQVQKRKTIDISMHKKREDCETYILAKDNNEIPITLSLVAIRDDRGNITSILHMFKDLCERKRIQQRETELEMEIRTQHRLSTIGSLVQGIAHNLSSPLSVILARVQMLELGIREEERLLLKQFKNRGTPDLEKRLKLNEKNMKNLKLIDQNVDKLLKIINNMMYKIRQEQTEDFQWLNMNEILSEELKFLEGNMFFKHEVEKSYHFDESLPSVKGVYSDFSQAFVNIIKNGLDAMHNTTVKKLGVNTYQKETNNSNHICIDIYDTGCGIKEEDKDKIFQPFFTTKPLKSSDGTPTGTGLGLLMCHDLLTPYGAYITIKSKPGNTIFTILIPV